MKLLSFGENVEGTKYFVVCLIFQVLACVACALRFWSRKIQKARPQISDWSIIAALLLSIANMGILGASVRVGMGVRIAELMVRDPELIVMFSKFQTTIGVIWTWNLFAVKVSIIDTYIKIFRIPLFIKVCYAYLALQVMWVIAATLNQVLLCRPLAFQWDKTIPGGVCGDFEKSYFAHHILIFLLDFILAVLPIPVLWNLRMNMRKKVGIMLMFSIGMVVGVFDLMRVAWSDKVSSQDITYDYALLFCFTLLEPQLGIVLASIPIMQPVLRRWAQAESLKGLRSMFTGSRSTTRAHRDSTPLKTFGSGGKAQKQFSDTESVRPLGEGGSFTEPEGYTPAQDKGSGPGHGQIHVTQAWDVQR